MPPSSTTLFLTPTTRFHALQTRNPLASNSFIYSVLTTRIYCRPTCPSRLARRANIVFHNTPAEAAAAGFRPCKRCKPDVEEGGEDLQVRMVERVCGLLDEEGMGERDGNGNGKWSVKALAAEVGWTESHFCRVFKRVTGRTVGAYRGEAVKRRSGEGSGDGVERVKGASSSAVESLEGFDRTAHLHASSTSSEDDLMWLSNESSRIMDGNNDYDFSSFPFDLEGITFGATETQLPEDCFEFLDFGSPPPLAFSV